MADGSEQVRRSGAALGALLAGLLMTACAASAAGTSTTTTTTSATASTTSSPGSTSTVPHGVTTSLPSVGRDGVPSFRHVFVVVMENLGDAPAMATPGFASLARRYAVATNYWAIGHPSLPNYLAITSGRTWGITSDCTSCYVSADNLGAQFSAAHLSWGGYFQGVPSSCYLAPYSGALYAGKHNPFRYYTDIRRSRALCSHLQPFGVLAALLRNPKAGVPRFVWVTPNICNDGHNCAPPVAAAWLDGFVASVVRSPAWRHGGVLFVTWDESYSGGPMGGKVLLLVIAPGLRRGLTEGLYYTDYSLLATIEDAFDLPLLQHAHGARPLTAFFARR